jgi:hypothetical protein
MGVRVDKRGNEQVSLDGDQVHHTEDEDELLQFVIISQPRRRNSKTVVWFIAFMLIINLMEKMK